MSGPTSVSVDRMSSGLQLSDFAKLTVGREHNLGTLKVSVNKNGAYTGLQCVNHHMVLPNLTRVSNQDIVNLTDAFKDAATSALNKLYDKQGARGLREGANFDAKRNAVINALDKALRKEIGFDEKKEIKDMQLTALPRKRIHKLIEGVRSFSYENLMKMSSEEINDFFVKENVEQTEAEQPVEEPLPVSSTKGNLDDVWGKLKKANINKLLETTSREVAKIVNDRSAHFFKAFYADHQKAVVNGVDVGHKTEFEAFEKTIDDFQELAVKKYGCRPNDEEKMQKKLKICREGLKAIETISDKELASYVTKYRNATLNGIQLKLSENYGSEVADFIKECIKSYSSRIDGDFKESSFDKALFLECGHKCAVQNLYKGMCSSILKNATPFYDDAYVDYRAKAMGGAQRDIAFVGVRQEGFCFNFKLKDPGSALLKEDREAYIGKLGFECRIGDNFLPDPEDSKAAKAKKLNDVIREVEWVVGKACQIANPDVSLEEERQFVEDFVNKVLAPDV